MEINNTFGIIKTCTLGSKHGMLNSHVAVPSEDLGPPAVIDATSLLIAENTSLKALFIPRNRGIMCFEFVTSLIFSEMSFFLSLYLVFVQTFSPTTCNYSLFFLKQTAIFVLTKVQTSKPAKVLIL